MEIRIVLLIAIFCFSFRPSTEKVSKNTSNGFYVFVEDHIDRTYHKYIVESKDSVNTIFNNFFNAELELCDVDRPISIDNGKFNFYIARVTVFERADGKKNFKHLKYPNIYGKRSKLKPVTL